MIRWFVFSITIGFAFSSLAIFKGEMATEKQAPAAVHIWSIVNNTIKFRCSGTLIAPDVVITESTCLLNSQTLLVSDSLTTDFKKPLSDIIKRQLAVVKSDVRHPNENLALLFLSQAVPIKPAVLLQSNEAQQLFGAKEVRITGWGYREPPPLRPSWAFLGEWLGHEYDLRMLGVKYSGISHLNTISEKEIDFGLTPEDALACSGDEGGPIIITVRKRHVNRERLVGMIRTNSNLPFCAQPSYGLRFDTFHQFIQDEMSQACIRGKRAWCDIKGIIPPEFDDDGELKINPSEPIVIESSQSPPIEEPKIKIADPSVKEQKKPKKNVQIKMESVGCSCRQTLAPR